MVFDLADYLCPITPGRYLLLGVEGTSSYEICSSIQDAKGYIRFLKNKHHETLWKSNEYIFRGLDTSSLPGEVYAQWSGERYGAPWAKRFMEIGETFKRHPDIRFYDANGNEKRRADGGVSYLKLVRHYDSITFPQTKQTVSDVLELNWTSDEAGQHVIETYWYAKGLSLCGFDYFGETQFHSRFGGMTGEQNAYEPLPNFVEPTPPPVEGVVVTPPVMPPTTPAGEGIRAACNAPAGVYLRRTPSASGEIIRALKYAEEVTVWEQPAVPSGIYTFIPVLTRQGEQGYAAQKVDINGVWSDTFIKALLPGGFTLKAPFRRYTITSRFNEQRSYGKHEGTDVIDANAAAYKTDPVIHVGAPATVVKVDTNPTGYGLYVVVDFGNNWRGWYGHLAECYVRSGQVLTDWQIVGLMGNSGNSTGAHCHVTVQHIGAGQAGFVVADVIDPETVLVAA